MTGGLGSTDAAFDVVREIASKLDGLNKAELDTIGSDQLLSLAQEVEILARKLHATQVHLVRELEEQGAATTRAYTSLGPLLRDVLLISTADANARLRAARALLPQDPPSGGETPPKLPLFGAALDAGTIGADHIRTTIAVLNRLENELDVTEYSAAEAQLIEHATVTDPEQFKVIAKHLENVANPDGREPIDPTSKMELHIGSRSAATGLTTISGHLDDLSAATLRAVVDSLAAPKPEADGIRDLRPAPLRRAQALTEALTFVLNHGDEVLPEHGGQRPHVSVTMDWDVVRQQAGVATIHRVPLSPGDARRVLCDAEVLPAVLKGGSEVLDLGRTTRVVTPAIRRALALRDKGCAWPGCDRPPNWTDAHHARWWARDLGETSYENCVLLCARHHTEIHKAAWTIVFARDGVPEFIPPAWLDRARRPRRNTLHQLGRFRLGSAPPGVRSQENG